MTTQVQQPGSRRSLVTSIALVVALLVAAIVWRGPLVAWFTGASLGGSEGKPVTIVAGPFSIKAALDPDPPRERGNALVLEIEDTSGKPVEDATVSVGYDMAAMGTMPEMKGGSKLSHESGGRYRAEFDLPMSSSWTLKSKIHAPQGDVLQDFTMTVGSPGLSVGNSSNASPGGMASGPEGATTAPLVYPQAVFDALHAAEDAYDRIRTLFAQDKTNGVADDARTLSEALQVAAAGMPRERGDVVDAAKAAAETARRLANSTALDDARKLFAALSGDFLRIIGADARLSSGWHVFKCDMFEGHPRWMQRSLNPDNPYTGTKMPTCGTASTWELPMTATSHAAAGGPGEIDHYTCSMHPSVKQKAPGKCPICGMDLIPVSKEQQEQGVVMIDEARRQLIGVRTAPVVEAPMRSVFRAVGQVAYDEAALADVNLKVHGWITKLYVNQTGQRVGKGQTLFTMYSPELYNAEQDFLLGMQGAAASASEGDSGPHRTDLLARASRQRLHLFGLTDAQIDSIAKDGKPSEDLAIPSPASGFIIEKNVVEGAAVDAGMRLYRIAALNKVWVEADVYESDLSHVRVGQNARVTLDYVPGRFYDARVAYLYPYLDPKARTGRVRIELANKDLDLRPGMYANVELSADLGTRLQVPAAAVVYTGPRRLVFVDLGEGRFKPEEVKVGAESNGNYEVLAGLHAGDVVATSGVFLIAAEARISTAAKYWESSTDADDASAASAPSSAAPPSMLMGGAMPTHPMAAKPPAPTPPRLPSTLSSPADSASPTPASIYSCPMHPEVQSPVPGKCPKCGMQLVPHAGAR